MQSIYLQLVENDLKIDLKIKPITGKGSARSKQGPSLSPIKDPYGTENFTES